MPKSRPKREDIRAVTRALARASRSDTCERAETLAQCAIRDAGATLFDLRQALPEVRRLPIAERRQGLNEMRQELRATQRVLAAAVQTGELALARAELDATKA